MNIRLTTFSLLVAATCGLAFNQAAKADEQDVKSLPSMRFEFQSNTYAMDHVSPRHHYVGSYTPSSVHSGAAPKNLLGLDPSFVSKPAPLPAPKPPTPAPQATVAAKPILPSAFSSLFGHPANQAPLVASAPGSLPPVGAGAPAAKAGHLPTIGAHKGVYGSVIRKPKTTPIAARTATPIASYGPNAAYTPTTVLAGYPNGSSGSSAVVNTGVSGTVIRHHR